MNLSRRGILIGTLAGGGLVAGYLLRPRTWPLPLDPGRNETAFDAWIKISSSGIVSVAVPQLEMGQGVTTLIPQVVAVELGADWRLVAVEPAPLSPHYANLALAARWADLWVPMLPGLADDPGGAITRRWAESASFMATAEGTSLAAYEAPARAAAASVRAMLAKAAAARWDVDWQECTTKNGHVLHGKRRLSFGQLAQEAASYDPPSTPVLRSEPAHQRPGMPAVGKDAPDAAPVFARLDLPAKANGSFQFAGDVRLPGMVHAAIAHGPVGESRLAGFDETAARGTPGLITVVKSAGWLAAVASDWWAADRALTAMAPRFAARFKADSSKIESVLDQALRTGEAERIHQTGDPASAFATRPSFAMRYDVMAAHHAALETASATARFTGGRLELWVASQAPHAVRRDVAAALGIEEADIVLYPMPAGGSFDRRLEHEHAIEVAAIAREVGRPVQLMWSRWQEHLAALPRPPVSALMVARTLPTGEIIGWKARLAAAPVGREFGERLFGAGPAGAGRAREAMLRMTGKADDRAVEGARPPYAVRDLAVDHVPVDVGVPAGRMRGQAHGWTAFFNESFIDELAHKFGREPLSYRIAMLGHDLRLAACLQACATLANWGGGGDASGQGLACHVIEAAGSAGRIAAIATARRDENGLRVDRLSAVADIGRIVNLDIARQQIEGGLLFGMGLAIGAGAAWSGGVPQAGRLGTLGLPLLADSPAVEVDFIDSNADPFDPGELGVAVAAPAIANALFSATGLRFRRLPLLADEV
jgi:isoquinoline 1-oxidoreductase beta subunit